MRAHVEALFLHDAKRQMLRVNETNGAPAPRFFIGRTPAGSLARFRHDLEPELRELLEAVRLAAPAGHEFLDAPYGTAEFEAILRTSTPIERTWSGPAYVCPVVTPGSSAATLVTSTNRGVLKRYFDDWTDDAGNAPFAAVLQDGHAVSICASVRVTPKAHEAGVETHQDFRGHGYARRAVAAWAGIVQSTGAAALYSTSWSNVASQGLARSLGLLRFGTDVHIR